MFFNLLISWTKNIAKVSNIVFFEFSEMVATSFPCYVQAPLFLFVPFTIHWRVTVIWWFYTFTTSLEIFLENKKRLLLRFRQE